MKPPLLLLTVIILFTFLVNGFAAKPPTEGRTLADLNVIPTRVLKRLHQP